MERVYQDVRRQGDNGDDSLDFVKLMKMVQTGKDFVPKIQDFFNEHIPEDLIDKAKDKAKEFAPKIRDMKDKAVEFLPKMWNFVKENAGEYLKVKPSETDGEGDEASETAGKDYCTVWPCPGTWYFWN